MASWHQWQYRRESINESENVVKTKAESQLEKRSKARGWRRNIGGIRRISRALKAEERNRKRHHRRK
jgi:hypothetical protein